MNAMGIVGVVGMLGGGALAGFGLMTAMSGAQEQKDPVARVGSGLAVAGISLIGGYRLAGAVDAVNASRIGKSLVGSSLSGALWGAALVGVLGGIAAGFLVVGKAIEPHGLAQH